MFKFDYTNKWYMHNSEFVLENEMHEIIWYLKIQIDHLLSARRSEQVKVNKKREPVE